jgi:transposase, IS5 family
MGKPRERRETGAQDLFRARLDQILSMNHKLVRLVSNDRLASAGGAVRRSVFRRAGHATLPTRLLAGLAILKHTFNVSDEALCERWMENPYFRYLPARNSSAMSCRSTALR